VNLRIMEKEDLLVMHEWLNSLVFAGEYEPVSQETKTDLEHHYDKLAEGQWFFIQKKDGSKIGYVTHFAMSGKLTTIGYALVPDERSKGYGSEAVKIIVDYLFLSKDTGRIQAHINPQNVASEKVLKKAGFRKEGIVRKCVFSRGEWRDLALYSILREEWKEPKILTKTT
jgi:[ribosomal protein S5]-alanine N-acetyltransferase